MKMLKNVLLYKYSDLQLNIKKKDILFGLILIEKSFAQSTCNILL